MRVYWIEDDAVRHGSELGDAERAFAAGVPFWVDLVDHGADGERLLADVLAVHPLAIEDLWQDRQLPKVEDFDHFAHVIVHAVGHSSDADRPIDLRELDVLLSKRFVVTYGLRSQATGAPLSDDDMRRVARNLKRGPAWVAHAVLDKLVDDYVPFIDSIDQKIVALEVAVMDVGASSDGDSALMSELLRLKRSMQALRRTSIHQREVFLRLSRGEIDEIPEESLPFFRDVNDHFARVFELSESYRELLASLLDAHLSMQSNRMNEIMKRLTVISTIMLPLTFIAGVYGMNFEHMPETKWVYGYPAAIVVMLGVGVAILAWLKARRWV